ncbi:MAG TPA: MFS transporter [Candidatus Limnocylindria bacterium]|nr:MFS transporter [Candidatus Limnocylindria bacterium]
MTDAPPAARRWSVLAVLTGAYGLGAVGMLGVSPLTPSLMDGFSLSRLDVAFIVPSVYVGGLLFSLPGGHLADRWGVRPTLLGALVLGGAGLLGAALAPTFVTFLACLVVAGSGWSVVNPTLGKAIVDVFPVHERGIAMGIKQMGLTLGGMLAALVLPRIAAAYGWRAAVVACAVAVMLPVPGAWRPLAPLARPHVTAGGRHAGMSWWWATRPALLVLFASGIVLGMVQSALLAYLPVFAVQALGYSAVGAGVLIAASQAGGTVARLALGAASDRWLGGRRPPWLVFTSALASAVFLVYALVPTAAPVWAGTLAFAAGVGAYGWVGIYFIISAEAGGARHSGLLSGVSFAAIVVGLLAGAPLFGLVLEASDSYAIAWTVFAAAAALVAVVVAAFSPSIDRECRTAALR